MHQTMIDYGELRRMREAGMRAREIGKVLRVREPDVLDAIRAAGLPIRTARSRLPDVDLAHMVRLWNTPDVTVAEIARAVGTTTQHVRALADRHGLDDRPHVHRSGGLDEPEPADDEASGNSLDLAPETKRRIIELGLGMPKAEPVTRQPWESDEGDDADDCEYC